MAEPGTKQVVVVDDNGTVCRLLARLLTTAGFKTTCIDSGAQAVQFIRTCRPSVVLLDIMMPDVDGFDVLRTIRSEDRCKEVKILMYSALDDPEYRERALELGADDYIVKGAMPFEEIEHRVKRYVDRLDPE